jgi:hypothetical protein
LGDVPYYSVDRGTEAESDEAGEVVESEEALVVEMCEGYSKPLREVIERVELLGHTEAASHREFSYLAGFNGFYETLFTYDELAAVLRVVDESRSSGRGERKAHGESFPEPSPFPSFPFRECRIGR